VSVESGIVACVTWQKIHPVLLNVALGLVCATLSRVFTQ